MKTTLRCGLIAMIITTMLCLSTISTPLTSLSQTLSPLVVSLEPQQVQTFTEVTIKSIDGESFDWVDSTKGQTSSRPLFVYETPCIMSFVPPIGTVPGDLAIVKFIWCEEDDKSCEASTTVRVANVTLTNDGLPVQINFEIPHLSWSKYMSSHIQFQIEQNRNDNLISLYKSIYIYESDFATKGTKTAIVIVVVFSCVCIFMALAVLGYLIAKKVKKMRRQRHFPTQSGGHNLWRRS